MKITFDEAAHRYTVDGVEVPSVTEVCRFLSVDLKSDRPWSAEAAARRGTAVHAACALIDYGEEPEETPEIAGYLKAYRRFLKDYRPEWEGIEYVTGSAELGLAGTVDRFGTLYDERSSLAPMEQRSADSTGKCRTCILDIKSGARLHLVPLRAQLTGYRRLLYQDRAFSPTHLYGLHLTKEGTYTLREVPIDNELLDVCLYMHKASERKRT